MSIAEKLVNIQSELKAPKGQFNSFGKYSYRNAEDILEAVKPLLKKDNVALTLTDELVNIGDRYYIKATVRLFDDKEHIEVSAYAREEESKKGMDGSQVTGASSSYARKYALNGLFCIDDTKDSDATNVTEKGNKEPTKTDVKSTLTDAQIKRLYAIASKAGIANEKVSEQIKKKFNKDSVSDLTKAEYDAVCNGYENKAKEKENE